MERIVKLYSLDFDNVRTYMAALLFVAGNVVLPQLCHLVPQGGIVLLPIYFFTLVGAYKYGWRVGLLTALASPVVNSCFFGMPASSVLPAVLLKSVLLALAAGWAAHRFRKVSVALLLGVVMAYQIVGTLGEWAMKGDFFLAVQDFRLGVPGMLVQVFGGYLFIKYMVRR